MNKAIGAVVVMVVTVLVVACGGSAGGGSKHTRHRAAVVHVSDCDAIVSAQRLLSRYT